MPGATGGAIVDVVPGEPARITLSRGAGRAHPANASFALEFGRQRLLVAEGEHIIGRGADSDIVLDCDMVSRRHARLTVTATNVFVEDLDSVNGVTVDGRPVKGKTLVAAGSRIGFADAKVMLIQRTSHDARVTRRVPVPDTKRADSGIGPAAAVSEGERRARAFELLARVVDKAFALGQPAEAERLLGGLLREVLEEAEAGHRLPQSISETAARQALKLADATGSGVWATYPVRLYLAIEQVLPTPMIDQLYTLVRRAPDVDATLLVRYTEVLEGMKLGPADRFGVQRLRTLAQMQASRTR